MALDNCVRKQEIQTYVGSEDPQTQWEIPVVDLGGRRGEVVEKVKMAATTVGFFQVVNHGVPESLMEEMLNMSRELHELPEEEKLKYNNQSLLSSGLKSAVSFSKSHGSEGLSLFTCTFTSHKPMDPTELPQVCRGALIKYSQHMEQLATLLFEILSVALGLKADHLLGMDCAKGHFLALNYYAKTEKSEPTIGISKHADLTFLTILVQGQIGGLQVLHQNQWLNVPPVSGALIVNIGDFLKLISNDAFTSAEHRVWANNINTRVSVPCFFTGDLSSLNIYGPIEELLSENSPPLYRRTTVKDFMVNGRNRVFDGSSTLAYLKL